MYFCAFGLVAFAPLAYAICQVLTFIFYEGRWRWRSLAPIPVFVACFAPLLYVHTPIAFVIVSVAAPALAMVALAIVWGQYTKHARLAADTDGQGDPTGEHEPPASAPD